MWIGSTCRLRRTLLFLLLTLPLLVAACATTPVEVVRMDPRRVHRALARDVLSAGEPSGPTLNVLYEQNLFDLFDDEPETALAKLHGLVVPGSGGPNELFALAELSFLRAEESKRRPYNLAAAVYAFAFLFPRDPAEAPNAFDVRLREAVDLYNRGLTSGFESTDGSQVELREGSSRSRSGSSRLPSTRRASTGSTVASRASSPLPRWTSGGSGPATTGRGLAPRSPPARFPSMVRHQPTPCSPRMSRSPSRPCFGSMRSGRNSPAGSYARPWSFTSPRGVPRLP